MQSEPTLPFLNDTVRKYGRLDILVSNAAHQTRKASLSGRDG